MSENTKIEWCDHTWSPWRGCTKVSPGCANCYAEALSKRNPAVLGNWGKGKPRVLAKNWGEPVRWNRVAGNGKCDCCGSTRDASNTGNCKRCGEIDRTFTRPRVFPSLCDWLDDEVPIEWLARFLALIHDTPNLDWLLLTKRPENWLNRIEEVKRYALRKGNPPRPHEDAAAAALAGHWSVGDYPINVWIGTSVEDQIRADERIPALLKIPARRRFLSVEPMLGPVDLSMWLPNKDADGDTTARYNYEHPKASIHWVIVGGESGSGARPCNVEWIRDVVRQCAAAGVPCFVKQLGSNVVQSWNDPSISPSTFSVKLKHPKGGDPAEWPEDLRVRQFPEVVR